eukprot:9267352-Pyramimonas_sp.AAC.1
MARPGSRVVSSAAGAAVQRSPPASELPEGLRQALDAPAPPSRPQDPGRHVGGGPGSVPTAAPAVP